MKPCRSCGQEDRYPSGWCRPCAQKAQKKFRAKQRQQRQAAKALTVEREVIAKLGGEYGEAVLVVTNPAITRTRSRYVWADKGRVLLLEVPR